MKANKGPGHYLKAQLSRIGIHATEDCPCNSLAAQMDCRGTKWCRENSQTVIIPSMKKEAKKRKLVGKLWNEPSAAMLVERAVRLAEADGWHTDDRCCPQPAEHPNIVCGMTTAPRRQPTLVSSVESLARGGYTTVVYAEPNSPQLDLLPPWCEVVQRETKLGVWHNWYAMAHELLERADLTGAEYVATFQDDIQCSPHLRTMVESFPFDDRNGCLLLYTPSHYCWWEAEDHGWHPVATDSLWGLLGMAVRREEMRRLLDTKEAKNWLGAGPQKRPDESEESVKERRRERRERNKKNPHMIANADTAFGRAVRTKMHCHVPSLIRHTARFSSIGHGGNQGRRNSSSLLMKLPPPEKRTTIPPVTKRPDPDNPIPEKTNGVIIHKDAKAKSPVCKYHHAVRRFISTQKPGTLLDVGSGIGRGIDWLKALKHFKRVSVELEEHDTRLPGVEMVFSDFLQWPDQRSFDYVVCMQVLEHVDNPPEFAARLFERAKQKVVISIPYQWPPDVTGQHQWHGLNEKHLREWVGRDPLWSKVVSERGKMDNGKPITRLVAAYEV